MAADHILVNAIAPGLRKTNLNAWAQAVGEDPAEAAAGAVRLALLGDDDSTAGFFSWDGIVALVTVCLRPPPGESDKRRLDWLNGKRSGRG